MPSNNNFNPESFASSSLIWWTGVIVSDETWSKNIEPKKWSDTKKLTGWGSRYKVRIFGRHPASKTILADDRLELCEVLFPVTAGTGHAAAWQSANLRQGSTVIGFYKDGIDGNEPIIMGCIGNNEQTLLGNDENLQNGFFPLSGFGGIIQDIPYYSIVGEDADGNPATAIPGVNVFETSTDSSASRLSAADAQGNEEDKKSLADCKVGKLSTVSVTIKNLILGIEKNRSQFKSWKNAVNKNDFADINRQMNEATTNISAAMKEWIGAIKPFIDQLISSKLREGFQKLNPAQQAPAQDLVDVAMQEIHCLFRRILDGLFQIVGQFLSDNILKYVNAPICAIENIVGTLIGNATNLVRKGIEKALQAVQFVGDVIDLGDSILGFIQDVLEFSFCDPKVACPDLTEWDIWNGADFDSFQVPDLPSVISKAKNVINSAKSTANLDDFTINNLSDEFDLSGIVDGSLDSCNIGPISCGPPQVQIFGGGGREASANAVVGALGEILAVDVTNYGFDFKSEPIIKIVDPCGRGKGALAQVRVRERTGNGGRNAVPVLSSQSITQNIISAAPTLFGDPLGPKEFGSSGKFVKTNNPTQKIKFTVNRDEDSGSFFQFKLPGERRATYTGRGKRQFSISTADAKKKTSTQIELNLAANREYSIDAFVSLSKKKTDLNGNTLKENEAGARGDIFNKGRVRVPLSNKRIKIQNLRRDISLASNKTIRAGSTIALDDITRIKRGIQNRLRLRYTNLSSANSPILYKKEQIRQYVEGTDNTTIEYKDFDGKKVQTSLLREVRSFLESGRTGEALFYRDDSGNNINGVLLIENLGENPTKRARFTENGNNVFAVDPTQNTRFVLKLIYKDGARQGDRIFDKLTVNKKNFNILTNTSNENSEGAGAIVKRFTLKGVKVEDKEDAGRDPDEIYDDLVITADQGYFYFDKTDRKYYFRVDKEVTAESVEEIEEETTIDGEPTSQRFNIVANKTKVERYDYVNFNISTLGVKDNEEYYWVINQKRGEITSSDFLEGDVGQPNPSTIFADTRLSGKISIRNGSAKIIRRINKSASVGDAFTVTLSRSTKQSNSKIIPSPLILAESQIVTVVDDVTSPDPDPQQPFNPDTQIVGIGGTTAPLIDPPTPPVIPIVDPIIDTPTPIEPPGDPTDPPGDPVIQEIDDPLITDIDIDPPGLPEVTIVDVVIVSPGSGYTSTFDGSTGGLGRVWSGVDDTISRDTDGNWNVPIPPGNNVCFSAGDKVTLPAGTIVVTVPRNGKGGGETIIGGSEYTLKRDGCLTTPPSSGDDIALLEDPDDIALLENPFTGLPGTNTGAYPVNLCLEEIVVVDPGFGYTQDDILIINPSNGAKAEFKLGPFGVVESVRLLERDKVCGFKERPEITIQSETGRNAKLVPKFSIDRIPVDTVDEPGIFEEYITVIDCVGRAPEQDFFRVPD